MKKFLLFNIIIALVFLLNNDLMAQTLTVSPSNQSVTYVSGTTTFSISSNTSWSLSDDATWLTVSPTSGSGNRTITATYQENTTTSQRVGTITVIGGGITRTVTVTQAAAPFTLTVSPSNQSVTNASGSTAFTITSNTSWSVSDNATWLTVSPASGTENGAIIANYSENTTTSQRVGTITVTGGGITRTVTVTQAAAPFTLTVSPSNQSVTNASGSTAFTITSNTSWNVSDDATWLTVSPASGSGDTNLTATYQENISTSQRVGTITITGSGITRTVTVTQSAAPFTLTINPSNRSVTNASGSTTFTITSNTSWSVSDNVTWLTVSPISGSGNGTLTATYQENTTTSQRVGTITVTGGGITRTVTVTQSAAPFILTVSPSNQLVTNASGSTAFTITSNTSWSVSDNATWLTVSPTSGTENGAIIANYSENTITSQRVGTITVIGGGITRTVTVTQSAAPFILTVSPSNQLVTNASGSTAFTITSNTSWSVSDNATWLTVNPTSGSGDSDLTATYQENISTSQRVGTITITGSGITRTVTVTQSAAPFILTVSPSNQLVTNASGSTEFTITSNTSWSVSDDATWLTISPTSGSGNGTLTATYKENKTTSERVGTITITGGGITETVTVTQSATPFILTVSPSNQLVTNASGSTEFAITSNTSWSVSDDATWLTVSPASGSGDTNLTATYQENISTSQRVGTITITGSGITRTVTVTQAAAPFILTVSPSNQSVTNISGSTTFAITSNTSWNVSDDATWLTVSPASGSDNSTLTATYQENITPSQRVGTITVIGGGITRTVTVTQAAAPFILTVSPSNRSLTNLSGSTTFTITSNTSWNVSDDATWLTVSPTSGTENGAIIANYSENTTTSQRVGTITVIGGGITRTVTVSQESTPSLTITPLDQFVAYTEGSTSFTITSTRNWTVEDNADWITVTPTSGSNDGTLTVTYLENTNTIQRVGTITVTGGGITRTVTVTQESAPLLTVTPSDQYVGNTEGNTTFTITSNRSWTVEDDADWITVTPTSGSNDGTLTVTYLENTNIIQRVGTITVTGSGITRTVTVTQESAPLLTVTPSDQYVGNTEGNTTFTITSNRSWTVEDDADWITVTPTSGSNDGTLTVTYLENTNTIQRVGTITVTGGGITRTVTVTQESTPSLTIAPLDQFVGYTEGSTSFTITSNRSWTVEDDADWITVTPTSGSNDGTLTVTYLENTNTIQRVGTITVTGGGITRTVTVTQESAPLLTVTPPNEHVGNTEGNITFTITSNRSWTVEDNADWITVTPTSGSNDGTLTVTYSENTNTIQRVGTITVTGGGLTRTVTVTQSETPFTLTVNPSNQSVTNASGSTAFMITSNTSWAVSDDVEWLIATPENGTGNGVIIANYSENTTISQRIGTITVTGGGITRIITVTQAAGSAVLTVNPSNQSVTNASDSTTFTVTSNTNWTVSDDATWLMINPVSGTGDELLTATYTENTTTSLRVGTITVTGGGITRTVTVTQAAAPFTLTVSPSNQSVTNASDSTTFTVTSNTNWTVSDDATWLMINPVSGTGDELLTATYTENTTTSLRVGTITVTGGGITRTVTVTQSTGSAVLTVNPSNQSVTNESGSTAFIVASNTDWTVEDDADWITMTPTSGSNDGTLTVTYLENTNTIQRVGTITVTGGGLTRTVTVTQESTPLLTVTPPNENVGNTEGSTAFTITSNRNWTVEDDEDWITVTPTSGSNDGTLTVTYSENTSLNQRICKITVTGGGLTRTVTVTQSATPFTLKVSPLNQSVTNTSGSTAFTITSNTSWAVSDDVEWMIVTPTTGTENGAILADYLENTNTIQRVGTITVTGGGITRTVTVTQAAAPFILTVSPSNQSVTNVSGSTAFIVASNTDWTVEDDADWITVTPTSGSNDGALIAVYLENTNTIQRIGKITITGGGITRTVTVTQESAPLLTVTPSDQYVGNAEGNITFTITSNRNWTVEDDADWITVTPTSGSNDGALIAVYLENTNTIQRIGKITITGGGITRTVLVIQRGLWITLNYIYSFGDPSVKTSYQIIGLPGANNLSISSVMTGLPGKEGSWRAFWDSGTLPLTEYNGDSQFSFTPGKAFWVISRNPININQTVAPVALSMDSSFSIQIHDGWNLISNPFDKVIAWSSINAANGGDQQPIYSFQTSGYSNPSDFEPYKGYYFFSRGDVTTLKIPYYDKYILGKTNSFSTKELEIALTSNSGLSAQLSVGISEDAKSGVDRFDIFSPPSLFCDVSMSLFNNEIETNYKYLQKEFRPEIGEGQDFDILVKNVSNETLKLFVKGLKNFHEYEVYLLDKSLKKLNDLRKFNNIEVKKNTSGKEYTLIIGTEEYISQKKSSLIPAEYFLYQNYPNPFNAKTIIMFALPQQSKISLNVYNMLGELVAEIINDQLYEKGYHEVSADFGQFASGIYLYKLQTSSSGRQPFVEIKKMVLLK